VLGKTDLELVPGPDAEESTARKREVLATGQPWSGELRRTLEDGPHVFETTILPEVFLSPNAWRVYTAAVLRAFGCVVWWSAPVYGFTQDGKLAYVPQTLEQLEPYVDTLASEALRLRKPVEEAAGGVGQ
jgi:hypothetical protein